MLLNCVAVHRIVEEKGEVREQIEERPAYERVDLPDRAVVMLLTEIARQRAGLDLAAFAGIEETEAVHLADRNLPGGVVVIQAAVELHRKRAVFRKAAEEIGGDVVAPVAQ